MSRVATIQDLKYLFNSYENFTSIEAWSDEMSRMANKAVENGILTPYEAHKLSHTGNI